MKRLGAALAAFLFATVGMIIVVSNVADDRRIITPQALSQLPHGIRPSAAYALSRKLEPNSTGTASLPRAVTDERVYNFGTMDPLTKGRRVFVVRNHGTAPLKLEKGETTCKCTISHVTGDTIPPGGSGQVVLDWSAGHIPLFTHSATILTNDPLQRKIVFQIQGKVRVLLGSEPEQLEFPRVAPGEPVAGEVLVYSQAWQRFEITATDVTVAGAMCRLRAASAAELAAVGAQAGQWLHVDLPPDLPEGYFHGSVRLTVDAPESDKPARAFEVPVDGRVLRRLAIYGPAIDATGRIYLGTIRSRQGKTERLLMKVRDEQRDLTVKALTVQPEFVHVDVRPYQSHSASPATSEGRDLGLYELVVTVPPGAPVYRVGVDTHAAIHLEFNHPRIAPLDLPLEFEVTVRP